MAGFKDFFVLRLVGFKNRILDSFFIILKNQIIIKNCKYKLYIERDLFDLIKEHDAMLLSYERVKHFDQ